MMKNGVRSDQRLDQRATPEPLMRVIARHAAALPADPSEDRDERAADLRPGWGEPEYLERIPMEEQGMQSIGRWFLEGSGIWGLALTAVAIAVLLTGLFGQPGFFAAFGVPLTLALCATLLYRAQTSCR